MSNSRLMAEIQAVEPWSEIRAHNQSMRYRRLGAGRSLLFLDSATQPQVCAELRAALAGTFRLILPELPSGDVHLAGWLADLLDGIGSSNVGVIAPEGYCVAAIELALLGVDQIARVVIVCSESRGQSPRFEASEHGQLASASHRADIPMLLIHRGQTLHEIVSLVRRFLGES